MYLFCPTLLAEAQLTCPVQLNDGLGKLLDEFTDEFQYCGYELVYPDLHYKLVYIFFIYDVHGQGCLVQVGNDIKLNTVGHGFESSGYRWHPCGVTWDAVPEQLW